MVRNQKIHIDANLAVACIRRDRPVGARSTARKEESHIAKPPQSWSSRYRQRCGVSPTDVLTDLRVGAQEAT